MKKTALFSISSLGLGHAARTAPLVRSYLETHDIHIVCTGAALNFLRDEFAGTSVSFHDLRDYPPLERGRGTWRFYPNLVIDSLATTFLIQSEHAFVRALVKDIKPEFIISDGKYGSYYPDIPSFLVCHQISFIMPHGFGAFQGLADWFNYRTFKNFDSIIIPDYEDAENNLAGKLSHHPMLEKLSHEYVGILTLSSQTAEMKKDIDTLFTISGYLDEHRQSFVSKLIELAKTLPGKKVFVLGRPGEGERQSLPEYGIEIYPSASGALRTDLFSRAKTIVSRSGYTTIMDLVELGTPGLLMPTPGQSEQEYLAEYLGSKNLFITASNETLTKEMIASLDSTKLFSALWKTSDSVRKVQALVRERLSR